MAKIVPEKVSFFDRVTIAFLNALVGLPTASLLWVVLNGIPWAAEWWLPPQFIIWFTLVVVILGMFMQDVLLLNLYTKCWDFLVFLFKHGA